MCLPWYWTEKIQFYNFCSRLRQGNKAISNQMCLHCHNISDYRHSGWWSWCQRAISYLWRNTTKCMNGEEGIQIKKGSSGSWGIAWRSDNMPNVFISSPWLHCCADFLSFSHKNPWPTSHHVGGVWESCDITVRPSWTSRDQTGRGWVTGISCRRLNFQKSNHNLYQMWCQNVPLITQFIRAAGKLNELKIQCLVAHGSVQNRGTFGLFEKKKPHLSDFLLDIYQ